METDPNPIKDKPNFTNPEKDGVESMPHINPTTRAIENIKEMITKASMSGGNTIVRLNNIVTRLQNKEPGLTADSAESEARKIFGEMTDSSM